jgi:hypothetical protein
MTFWDDEIFMALGVKISDVCTGFDMANLSIWLYAMT